MLNLINACINCSVCDRSTFSVAEHTHGNSIQASHATHDKYAHLLIIEIVTQSMHFPSIYWPMYDVAQCAYFPLLFFAKSINCRNTYLMLSQVVGLTANFMRCNLSCNVMRCSAQNLSAKKRNVWCVCVCVFFFTNAIYKIPHGIEANDIASLIWIVIFQSLKWYIYSI